MTVNKWAVTGKWDELKAGITITRDNLLSDIRKAKVSEINKAIAAKPEDPDIRMQRGTDKAQFTADIKKLQVETGLDDIIDVLH